MGAMKRRRSIRDLGKLGKVPPISPMPEIRQAQTIGVVTLRGFIRSPESAGAKKPARGGLGERGNFDQVLRLVSETSQVLKARHTQEIEAQRRERQDQWVCRKDRGFSL